MRGLDPSTRAAYAHCRRIQAAHGRSFYRATCFLPPSRRMHVWALYALTRVTDDLVDRPSVDREVRATQLAGWTDRCLTALSGPATPSADDPVLRAVWHTMHRLDLPVALVQEFFSSMRMDLRVSSYRTWTDLQRYMRGSAAVIGELMSPVLGAPPHAQPYAAALGEAFQLTNFVRDVAEDLALGRVYLPLDDLADEGVDADDLRRCAKHGTITPSVRAALEVQIRRARSLYARAAPGVALLDPSARPCIRVASALYSEILVEIERRDHNVFAGRVVVPRSRRALVATRALTPGGRPGAAAT